MLAALPPHEVITLLQTRLGLLEESIAGQRTALAAHGMELPRLFLVENEYAVAILEAESAWVRSLLEELTSGTYPALEMWRAWHTTGELPPDLAELAERGAAPQGGTKG